MGTPSDVRFAKTHEWARKEGDVVVVGISEHAVDQMNKEITYLELPEPGRTVRQGESCGVIDTVKATFDLYSPVSGKVVEANTAAAEDLSLLTEGPFTTGWLIKVAPTSEGEWETLMDASQYEQFQASEDSH